MSEFINIEDQILKIGMPTLKLKLVSLEKLKKHKVGGASPSNIVNRQQLQLSS